MYITNITTTINTNTYVTCQHYLACALVCLAVYSLLSMHPFSPYYIHYIHTITQYIRLHTVHTPYILIISIVLYIPIVFRPNKQHQRSSIPIIRYIYNYTY